MHMLINIIKYVHALFKLLESEQKYEGFGFEC